MKTLQWLLCSNLAAVVALLFSAYEAPGGALLCLLIAIWCLLVMLRHALGSWLTLSHLFTVAFALYTLSGPFEVVFGTGRIEPFAPPFFTNPWLIDGATALLGYGWGCYLVIASWNRSAIYPLRTPVDASAIAKWLVLFAVLGEGINLWRAGGITTLLAGKAVYQAAVADLGLTVPTTTIATLGFAFLGLTYSSTFSVKKHSQLQVMLLGLPLLGAHLFLGQRQSLATYLLTFLLGYSYRNPLKRLRWKWFLWVFFVYSLFSFLFAFRWAFPLWLKGSAVNVTSDMIAQQTLHAMNPATNEFGAPFGNYTTLRQSGDHDLQFGATYLRGLATVIPGFLYPGEKPPSITYEFRDRFFPAEALRSRIAGTAFSSILEARLNFGDVGPGIVYFLMGSFLILMELIKLRCSSMWFAAFYCTLAEFAIRVHRSDTGGTVAGYAWILALLLFTRAVYEWWRTTWRSKRLNAKSYTPSQA